MAKEILSIPEDKLLEVIKVIRAGLEYVDTGYYLPQISNETREYLTQWCNEEEAYIVNNELLFDYQKEMLEWAIRRIK